MNEKIYLLHDKNSFPYGIFTNVNKLIDKYDNFDKRIKKFSKDDLYVSIIDCFNAFRINGIQKTIGSYYDFVNENRNRVRSEENYYFKNDNLILVFDFDEVYKYWSYLGAYFNLDTLIEHYNSMKTNPNVDVKELQFASFNTSLNKYSASGLISLSFEGGMLDTICEETY